jgi:putative flippase GtrA
VAHRLFREAEQTISDDENIEDVPAVDPMKALNKRSLLMFLFVGGFATGLQYVLALALISVLGIAVASASTIGYAISAVVNYSLNARLTFRSVGAHRNTAPRFLLVTSIGFALNYVILSCLIALGVHFAIAQIITTLSVILWNYAINGLWTFKPTRG